MTNLATIEKIVKIAPIEGADKIEVATVLGWEVVIRKGEYQVGDLVCYIVPDTTVPRAEWNKFLWPDEDPNGPRIRLKCKRLRKQVSMGLLINTSFISGEITEGRDVAEDLKIEKWEMPIPALTMGGAKGGFPSWLRVSDEDNLLGKTKAFEEIQDKEIIVSTKLDGSSGKFSLRGLDVGGEFQVFSRRLEVKNDGGNAWSQAAQKYDIETKLRKYNQEICLCVEIAGAGLNGNKMGLKELEMAVYDIWDIKNQRYLDMIDAIKICADLDIPMVPILYQGLCKWKTISELQEFIDPLKYENSEFVEGVVVRGLKEVYSPAMKGRLSFKLINKNFAAKYL